MGETLACTQGRAGGGGGSNGPGRAGGEHGGVRGQGQGSVFVFVVGWGRVSSLTSVDATALFVFVSFLFTSKKLVLFFLGYEE